MPRREVAAAAAALALALLGGACGEDPLPGLRAQKAEILEMTVPKAEFWDEVERKGGYFDEKKKLDKEVQQLSARAAEIQARSAELQAVLAQAESVNARAAEVQEQAEEEQQRLETAVAEREAILAGFEERRLAGASP